MNYTTVSEIVRILSVGPARGRYLTNHMISYPAQMRRGGHGISNGWTVYAVAAAIRMNYQGEAYTVTSAGYWQARDIIAAALVMADHDLPFVASSDALTDADNARGGYGVTYAVPGEVEIHVKRERDSRFMGYYSSYYSVTVTDLS